MEARRPTRRRGRRSSASPPAPPDMQDIGRGHLVEAAHEGSQSCSAAGRLPGARDRRGRTPDARPRVSTGSSPVQKRLPQQPLVVSVEKLGKHGGTLHSLVGRSRDARCWSSTAMRASSATTATSSSSRHPRVLRSPGRPHLHARAAQGHRWSDGHPFTAEDFRYYWEDVANNKELAPAGPPKDLLVEARSEVRGALRHRGALYWHKPTPISCRARRARRPFSSTGRRIT